MNFIHNTTHEEVTEGMIRARFSTRVFSNPMAASEAVEVGYSVLFEPVQPAYDPATHEVQRGANTCSNGLWYTSWVVSPLSATILQGMLKFAASQALVKSDITMLRCVEAGVAVPSAWNVYRKALRAIATGIDITSTVLPITPAFVAGT